MTLPRAILRTGQWLTAGAFAAVTVYLTYVAATWLRYGAVARPAPEERDALLDGFMPIFDIVERHRIRIAAPAETTLAAACAIDFQDALIVRAIVRAREIALGATRDARPRPQGLMAEVQALGWGVLAEIPGREIVVGAVTKPWEANVTFRALPSATFASFSEPGFVKIVWTLRADPVGDATSIFRTETRAVATDAEARRRFRRYWSFVSPGIIAIRWALVRPLKTEAERRARDARTPAAIAAGRQ
jgi:hypothetical protein